MQQKVGKVGPNRSEGGFGFSIEQLLAASTETNGKWETTAKLMRPHLHTGKKFSGAQVKEITYKLYEEYPDLYDPLCSIIPKGCKPRVEPPTATINQLHAVS